MEVTLFFAKFWGVFMIAFPLAFLIRGQHIKSMLHAIKDDSMVVVFVMFALTLGLFTVLSHNVWGTGLELVVTIIGWLALIKGLVYLFFPGVIKSAAHIYDNKSVANFLLVIALIIGLWISYAAFF